MEKNIAVIIIIAIASTLLLLTISVPALQRVFSFQFPGLEHFVSSITGATIILLIFESVKFLKNKRRNQGGLRLKTGMSD